MANKEQLKSLLVTLGSLALKVRDQLAESYDQDTYTNLLDELKQITNHVEETSADVAGVDPDRRRGGIRQFE